MVHSILRFLKEQPARPGAGEWSKGNRQGPGSPRALMEVSNCLDD